jgi:hypothetical protein
VIADNIKGGGAAAAATAGPPQEEFPLRDLEILERDLSASRWSIPIFEREALDVCLQAYRRFCAAGRTQDQLLLRFENGAMVNAFEKMLTNSAVTGWRADVLVCACVRACVRICV